MRPRPATVARRRGEVGLGERGALEQRVGVADEHERGIGQPDAAAGALEQPHAGLALEHRELLGDGRRRELERVGDRGDRAALVAARAAGGGGAGRASSRNATDSSSRIGIDADAVDRHDAAMRSSGTLMCLASGAAFGAMAIFGKLAYGEGATVGTLLAVRFSLAAALFWALVAAARRRARAARAAAPRRRSRLGARRLRLRRPGGLLLRGARADRRLAAVAAALHVPGDRRRRGGGARAASGWTPPASARSALGVGRARARRGRRGRGRARPARRGAGARRGARLQRLHPRERRASRGAWRRGCCRRSCARARRSTLDRRVGRCWASCARAR